MSLSLSISFTDSKRELNYFVQNNKKSVPQETTAK